jgi:hypothetical protein
MNNGSELDTDRKDQTQFVGRWNQLGTELYYFAAGTASVVLSDDADGTVVADAIKFELDAIVIDNPDATFVNDLCE